MKIYWVRHGKAENNTLGIWSEDPRRKVAITGEGEEHARILADKLKNTKIDVIFTSEHLRTKQTAKIINKFLGVEVEGNKLLNERRGGYDGEKTRDVIPLLEKDVIRTGGETIQEFRKRVYRFIEETKKREYNTVLVVTHKSVLQIIGALLKNLSEEELVKQDFKHSDILEQELP